MELDLMMALSAMLIILIMFSVSPPSGYPPGPAWLPLLGCFLQFRSLKARLSYHHLVWAWLARRYGPVAGIKIGRSRMVIISGYEAVKHVLSRDDCDGRPDGFIFRLRTYGQRLGVLFTEGPVWKEQRRFSSMHLKNLGLKGETMERSVAEEGDALVASIRERCKNNKGAEMSLQDLCAVSVINNLWAIVAGKRFELTDQRLTTLFNLLNEYFHIMDVTGGILNQIPLTRFVAPEATGYNHMKKTIQAIQDFLGESVKEHRISLQADDTRDLIDAYLLEMDAKKNDPNSMFTEQQLMSLLFDFFMAGAETTNNTLGFSLLYLLHHPEVQRRAQRDIDAVVGRARSPSLADKQKLPYVEAVIMEVQRMTTVVPTLPHSTTQDCKILGHRVPKDTMILPSLWSVLMDPEYWGDPEVFRPERFLDESGEKLTKEERFIQFGMGKHRCLGESLAKSSLFLFLTSLLQNFTFEMVPGKAPPSLLPQDGITLSPQPFTGIVMPR